MSKPTEACPGCHAERVGIAEGLAYFKCGSHYGQHDGRLIYQSEACKNAVPEGLFSKWEAK